MKRRRAFTLVELLVVIAIIAILASLLLTGLSRAKGEGQSVVCKSHLSQIGKELAMYVADNQKYPPALGGPQFQPWAERLTRYSSLSWTNLSWNCPTYLGEKGVVEWTPPPPTGGEFTAWSSYSYNAFGMSGFQRSGSLGFGKPWLGLGNLNLTVHEQQIVSPSEMYAVADARPFWNLKVNGLVGDTAMDPWALGFGLLASTEANAPHSQGYNLVFNDGHVALVKRMDYLYPPRTAHNWNRDNQPHPEIWSPTNQWAVQN